MIKGTKKSIILFILALIGIIGILREVKPPQIKEVNDFLVQEEQPEKQEEKLELEEKEVVEVMEKTNNLDMLYIEFGVTNTNAGIYKTANKEDVPFDFAQDKEMVSIIGIEGDMYKVLSKDKTELYMKKEEISLKPIVMFAVTDAAVYDDTDEFMNYVIKSGSDVEVLGKIEDKYKVIIEGKEGFVEKDRLSPKEVKLKE